MNKTYLYSFDQQESFIYYYNSDKEIETKIEKDPEDTKYFKVGYFEYDKEKCKFNIFICIIINI